jgi:hypothetical protein
VHAQGQGPLGFYFGSQKLVTGQWVAYWNIVTEPGARRDTIYQRIAVVDEDVVRSRPAHWIEIYMSGRTKIVLKALVLDEVLPTSEGALSGGMRATTAARSRDASDISSVVRLILKRGRQEPIELKLPDAAPLLRSLVGRGGPLFDSLRFARDDSLDLGEEEVPTARGTAKGHHTAFVTVVPPQPSTKETFTYATDVWTSPDVPITGIVRSTSRTIVRPPDPGKEIERSEAILAQYGIGARSLITGRVRLVTPPRAPLETGTR